MKHTTTPKARPHSPVAALPATFGGERYLKPAEVKPILGYTSHFGFWQAVKAAGIPYIRINQRRVLFEESAVRAWLDSRRVGSVPVNRALN